MGQKIGFSLTILLQKQATIDASAHQHRGGDEEGGKKGEEGTRKGNVPLCHDDWDVSPDIQLATLVGCRYLHARTLQALLQRASKQRPWRHPVLGAMPMPMMLSVRIGGDVRGRRRAGSLRGSDLLPPRAQARLGVSVIAVLFSTHVMLPMLRPTVFM